jgi:hypothetical protein
MITQDGIHYQDVSLYNLDNFFANFIDSPDLISKLLQFFYSRVGYNLVQIHIVVIHYRNVAQFDCFSAKLLDF